MDVSAIKFCNADYMGNISITYCKLEEYCMLPVAFPTCFPLKLLRLEYDTENQ